MKQMKPYIKSIIASLLVIFACIGFGRFAFGMVLPNIQSTLGLNTTQAGFIGTANFIGYFIGIFFTNALYNKFSTYKLIFVTLILQALSMFIMVLFNNYLLLSFFYAISGFFSAISNISTMSYMANIIPQKIRGKSLGIVVGGMGIAIILSGQIVPLIEDNFLNMPWKTSWVIFSFILVLVAFFCLPGIKKHAKHDMPETNIHTKEYIYIPSFWKIGILYMIFGFSYSIYVTFFVSAVIDNYDFSTSISGNFWALLGFVSIFSGYLFGLIADKIGAYKTMIFVYTFQTIAHLIIALQLPEFTIWFSAISFGISVWCIPSLITLLISTNFDVRRTAQILSLLTILFAICQSIGPILAGYLHDTSGSFTSTFLITSSLTLIAVLLSFIFSKDKIHQIKKGNR